MTVSKAQYFVTLFLVVWLASYIDAGCEISKGEIIQAGATRIVNCETLYVCDWDNNLRTYPACIKLRCKNSKKHRDFDKSKPWPQCCPRHTC